MSLFRHKQKPSSSLLSFKSCFNDNPTLAKKKRVKPIRRLCCWVVVVVMATMVSGRMTTLQRVNAFTNTYRRFSAPLGGTCFVPPQHYENKPAETNNLSLRRWYRNACSKRMHSHMNNNNNNNHHHHHNNNNHDTIHAKQAQESKDGNAAAADDTTTVEAILRASIQQLETAGVDEAADSVHHILSKVLNLSWSRGFVELRNLDASSSTTTTTSGEDDTLARRRLSVEEQALLQSLLARRQQHEPIQYIVGQWDFLDHVFAIVPPLLCPRPETEELVLYAAAAAAAASAEKTTSPRATTTRILDVGCGTGCIGISLAHDLPAAHVTALDVEPKAVLTARQNAQSILGSTSSSSSSSSDNEDDDDDNDERYTVHLCAAQDYFVTDDKHRFDLVVSNPPYIPARDMETLDAVVSEWESHHALCGGSDGLDVIRIILHQLPYWCRQGADCWMEVDPSHPAMLQELLEGNDHVEFVSSRRDLQGLDRFVRLRVIQEKNNKE